MEKRVVDGKKDANKSRAELLAELKASRCQISLMKDIIKRYGRVADMKDVYRSLYNLDARRDGAEPPRLELREKQKEIDLRDEELEILEEDLRARVEEANAKDDVITMQALMMASVNGAVIGLDMGHRITYWSRSAEKMYGYTAEEVMGQSSLTLFKSEYLGANHVTPDEVTDSLTEAVHSTMDGCRIIVESHAQPLFGRDGKPYGLICINRDITERKRAEEALRVSEERYRLLAETTRDMIHIIDRDLRVTYVNRASADALGSTPEEVIGKPLETLFPPVTYEHMKNNLLRVFRTGKPRTGQIMHQFYSGKISMHVILSPLFNDDGTVSSVMGSTRDITKLIETEEALREAKAQSELYLDLMGHDISNMHQIAIGYLEMVRDMQPEVGNREFLEKPMEMLQRSARLIKNVRKLQKLQEGEFRVQDVDVYAMLSEVRREYGSVPGKTVTLNLSGKDHCRISANELLYDVFANLVGNAIKHTGDRANIVVNGDIVADDGRKYCRVSIEDDGPGISDEFKGRIFNRMLKGTNHAKGMGLGLYLVKSLVDSYDGRVWVEDRVPGDHTKGAKFIVMLPATNLDL
ncbi:MAG TPA: PAS domain-containing sensor histidine kinase [Methanocella sp.]|nr:PAS domain-containing sensor histidine kinase [Methanocella sp.]